MKLVWLLFIPCILSAFDYRNDGKYHLFQDEKFPGETEVTRVFSSIRDINNPTVQDYINVENFLFSGKRSYLDPLYPADSIVRDFRLIGPSNEMPILEQHLCQVHESDREKCIMLFASYNDRDPEKVYNLLSSIKRVNYHGHILLRIGGFPNIQRRGLKLCHIPGAWKVAFFEEARMLGYHKAICLDLDSSIYDFDSIFDKLEDEGYFFLKSAQPFDPNTVVSEAIESLRVSAETLQRIDRIDTSVIGLNLREPKMTNLLGDWLLLTEKVVPAVTWEPDTLDLSVIAWKHRLFLSSESILTVAPDSIEEPVSQVITDPVQEAMRHNVDGKTTLADEVLPEIVFTEKPKPLPPIPDVVVIPEPVQEPERHPIEEIVEILPPIIEVEEIPEPLPEVIEVEEEPEPMPPVVEVEEIPEPMPPVVEAEEELEPLPAVEEEKRHVVGGEPEPPVVIEVEEILEPIPEVIEAVEEPEPLPPIVEVEEVPEPLPPVVEVEEEPEPMPPIVEVEVIPEPLPVVEEEQRHVVGGEPEPPVVITVEEVPEPPPPPVIIVEEIPEPLPPPVIIVEEVTVPIPEVIVVEEIPEPLPPPVIVVEEIQEPLPPVKEEIRHVVGGEPETLPPVAVEVEELPPVIVAQEKPAPPKPPERYPGSHDVDELHAKISNINEPTLEDYVLIENYLREGHRPYFDDCHACHLHHKLSGDTHQDIQKIKLLGPNNELPTLEKHCIGVEEDDQGSCVLIYSSYDPCSIARAEKMLSSIKDSDYKGHVLVRKGGHPNLLRGGLKLCHIPCSWKVNFLDEARDLGYKNVILTDLDLDPIKHLENIFEIIESNGYFLLTSKVKTKNCHENHRELKQLTSFVLGMNFDRPGMHEVLDEWMMMTEEGTLCMTCAQNIMPLYQLLQSKLYGDE